MEYCCRIGENLYLVMQNCLTRERNAHVYIWLTCEKASILSWERNWRPQYVDCVQILGAKKRKIVFYAPKYLTNLEIVVKMIRLA